MDPAVAGVDRLRRDCERKHAPELFFAGVLPGAFILALMFMALCRLYRA